MSSHYGGHPIICYSSNSKHNNNNKIGGGGTGVAYSAIQAQLPTKRRLAQLSHHVKPLSSRHFHYAAHQWRWSSSPLSHHHSIKKGKRPCLFSSLHPQVLQRILSLNSHCNGGSAIMSASSKTSTADLPSSK
ncbi:hypothetical protein COCNU_07G002930 [Cocos nucifera]|uniref:Uncharacterized protein n=1 Tax=Cocos nucifera TaxID=13894 RepID=A0A8K0IDT8_COCNU|nr:hypothetical protein COCNU_07G002930 [Cocos nucifera]